MTILTIFVVGMICAYACEPVDAKPIAKIKKGVAITVITRATIAG